MSLKTTLLKLITRASLKESEAPFFSYINKRANFLISDSTSLLEDALKDLFNAAGIVSIAVILASLKSSIKRYIGMATKSYTQAITASFM